MSEVTTIYLRVNFDGDTTQEQVLDALDDVPAEIFVVDELVAVPEPALVCVRFSELGGTSSMMSAVRKFPVSPQVGDIIEILPARCDEHGVQQISAWHGNVSRRYLWTSEESSRAIELHVDIRRSLSSSDQSDLQEAGYELT